MAADEKTCPFCAETIKAAAIVCKHCGRDLPGAAPEPALSADIAEKVRLYGIERSGDQWLFRGNRFDLVEGAIRMAETVAPVSASAPHVAANGLEQVKKPVKWWAGPLGGLALFLCWLMVRTPTPEESAKRAARDVIEACWKEQARKSHDADAARFIAGACEKAEADFRAQYRVSP